LIGVDYPGTELNVTYTYGTNPAAFDLGRLTGITRDGATVAYAYDRFGRLTQDGGLTFGYDKNGNRTSVGYPGGVAAGYTFDFADRESTLAVTSSSGTQPVVTASSYLPSGPLASLDLGNGNAETRSHTTRYFPQAIALDAARDRSYTFTTDAVGNVTSIAEAVECLSDVTLENRTVTGTEVHQSCATVTAGPAFTVAAGGSLTLRAATSVVLENGFSVASGASFSAGTDPDLDGSTWTFAHQDTSYFLTAATGPWGDLAWTYDRIGNRLTETRDGWTDTYVYTMNGKGGRTPRLSAIDLAVGGTRSFEYGPAGHLETVDSAGNVVDFDYDAGGRLEQAVRESTSTPFTYDGRSYLDQAGSEADATGATRPVYSSGGVLHTLTQRVTAGDPGETHHVFHFDGRPVAQLSIENGAETWRYLTTDHLGTPWVATDAAGAELWHGPFDPFGRDRWAGTNLAAAEEDVFLRFPGQWDDEAWLEATRGAEVYYNVHRWYGSQLGRYSRPDPVPLADARFVDEVVLSVYAYARNQPFGFTDELGLLALAPGTRCDNFNEIVLGLQELTRNGCCTDFFRQLGADLPSIVSGVPPFLKTFPTPPPAQIPQRRGLFLCGQEPHSIQIVQKFCNDRRFFNGRRVRMAVVSTLHELAHYADCNFNRNRFPGEEGQEAEKACFGRILSGDIN
jgi:RHS repeat-associated protein